MKNMKKLLSLLLTLLMIISSSVMIFAYADDIEATDTTDTKDRDHMAIECIDCEHHPYAERAGDWCSTCGRILPYRVNFEGTTGGELISGKKADAVYERYEDYVVITRNDTSGNVDVGIKFGEDIFTVKGHKYELTFWMENTAVEKPYVYQYLQILGGTNYGIGTSAKQIDNCIAGIGSISLMSWYGDCDWYNDGKDPSFKKGMVDIDTANNNRIYYKITVDGTGEIGKVYLAVKNNGAYAAAAGSRDISITDSTYINLNLVGYKPVDLGKTSAFGGVVIREVCADTDLCADSNENGACDICVECIDGNHFYVSSITTEPTCVDGEKTHYCIKTNCNATKITVIDALGHTEVIDAAVEPTCTETGLTEGKHCSVCNEVLVAQNTVDAKGHTFDNDCSDITCNVEGCNGTREKAEHVYDKEVVADRYLKFAATCTSVAVYYKSCDCGAKGTDSDAFTFGEANGHSFGEWTRTDAPTCTEKGEDRRDCENCEHYETRDVAQTDIATPQ